MTVLCVLTDLEPCISYVVVFTIIAATAVQDGCRGYDCLPGRRASVSVLSRNWGNSSAACVHSQRERGPLGGEGSPVCACQTPEMGSTVGTLLKGGTLEAELQCHVCLQSLAWAAQKHRCEEKLASRVGHLCPLHTWNTQDIKRACSAALGAHTSSLLKLSVGVNECHLMDFSGIIIHESKQRWQCWRRHVTKKPPKTFLWNSVQFCGVAFW